MPKPWPLIRSTVDKSYSVFSVRTDTACCPRTGQEHDFYVLESPDWVNVIPLTPDEQVVMVRQYRHGTRDMCLEIPGGLAKPADSVEDAARRELLEETGYEANELIFLGSACPQPAILNNRSVTYLARNVRKVGAPQLDQTEDIEVVLVSLSDIPDLIRRREITNAMVILAFYWYFMGGQTQE
ncbi:MAG: NUDIX hydrolase [Chloroflexi bacterium B3_Chlor]|nr:MAG: NUDIX hydrolase [Chloroflexi bacterium B3_Chlor]